MLTSSPLLATRPATPLPKGMRISWCSSPDAAIDHSSLRLGSTRRTVPRSALTSVRAIFRINSSSSARSSVEFSSRVASNKRESWLMRLSFSCDSSTLFSLAALISA